MHRVHMSLPSGLAFPVVFAVEISSSAGKVPVPNFHGVFRCGAALMGQKPLKAHLGLPRGVLESYHKTSTVLRTLSNVAISPTAISP